MALRPLNSQHCVAGTERIYRSEMPTTRLRLMHNYATSYTQLCYIAYTTRLPQLHFYATSHAQLMHNYMYDTCHT
jgi:hypothetical protein